MISYTLRQIDYFVTAANHGSIAEAARSLNVSQPSVSTAIAKLERLFGVQLFLRHHAQGVTLTPAGQRLLAETRGLLAHALEVQTSAARMGHGLHGQLNVGCFVTIAPFYMPRLIKTFEAEHRAVSLALFEGLQTDLLDGLETGLYENAILYDVDLPDHVNMELLFEAPPYVLLPPGHRFADAERISLRDLVAEPMVLLDVPPSRDYFTSLFLRHGLEPDVRFRTPSFETVRGLVGNGHGYSILVTRPAGDLTYDGIRLVSRPIAEDIPPGRIVLAYLVRARRTRLSETFANFCKAYFGGLDGPAS